MVSIAREQVSPDEEREEQPGLEGLRQVLRIVMVVSLASAVVLAVIPVFGTLGLLPALVGVLAYAGLLIVSRVEHGRWVAHHAGAPARGGEVGFRVVTGGAGTRTVDAGDATTDEELRRVAPAGGVDAGAAPRVAVPPPKSPAVEAPPAASGELFTAPQRAGAKVLLRIAVIVAVLAVVAASFMFDFAYLGIGLLLVLAAMTLFGFPVWLASAEDAAEAKKQQRLQRR